MLTSHPFQQALAAVLRVAVVRVAVACTTSSASAADLTYRTHWLGHAGQTPPAQTTAAALAVAADGTCVVSATTATGRPGAVFYRDGQPAGPLAELAFPGIAGAVTISENHIFLAVTLAANPSITSPAAAPAASDGPPAGTAWHGVWRFGRDGRHAPFDAGRLPEKAFLLVRETPAGGGSQPPASPAIRGLWVHEGELFASDAATDRIRVYDEASLAEKRLFRASEPSGVCVVAGNLQVIERGAVVTAYALNGRPTGQVLDESPDLIPAAVAPTPEGRMLVCDHGPSQQVHFFNLSGVPTRVRALGEEGGQFGPPNPGETGPRRFAGLAGAGTDAQGNLFVAMVPPPGGLVLRSFAPDRKSLRWQLAAPAIRHGADADPASDGLDIHSAEGRHAFDPARPPGESWRWVAQSVNPFRLPHDPRLVALHSEPSTAAFHQPAVDPASGTTTFREINGRKLLVLRSADGTRLSVYRMQAHSAMPSLIIEASEKPAAASPAPPGLPNEGPWLWRDTNGNGQFDAGECTSAPAFLGSRFQPTPIDAAGGLWLTRHGDEHRLCHWPCQGSDEHGIPLYPADPGATTPVPVPVHRPSAAPPQPFDSLHDPANDSLYLVATAAAPPEAASSDRLSLVAHDGWSQRTHRDAPLSTPRWSHPLPPAFASDNQPTLALAGRLLFVLEPRSRAIHVFETATGTRLGHLSPPASQAAQPLHPPSTALRAHRRRDGSYLVLIQDPAAPRALVYHLDDPRPAGPGK
jgi:hypothetical protein